MTASKWHESSCIGFDVESTGVNPHEDRIVTAAIVHVTPGQRPRTLSWLINPGIAVPAEAAEIHGWTNTRLAHALDGREARYTSSVSRQTPMTRVDALDSIAAQVTTAILTDTPLIAANCAFDLTLLEAELLRHGVRTVTSRIGSKRPANIIDPQVIEKAFDPFRRVKGGCRKGKHDCGGCGAENKTLTGLCAHYGVILAGAHDAGADALAAARLAVKITQAWPDVARLKLGTLYERQVGWRREQCDSLRAYFDKAGTEHDGVCGSWPLHRGCACDPARTAVA